MKDYFLKCSIDFILKLESSCVSDSLVGLDHAQNDTSHSWPNNTRTVFDLARRAMWARNCSVRYQSGACDTGEVGHLLHVASPSDRDSLNSD